MFKFRDLLRAVIGLPTRRTLDGRPLPVTVENAKPVVVVHDRRLSAGIFAVERRKNVPVHYRIVAWRTYADRQGRERATMNLHRDEVDPVLRLLAECTQRLSA
jgi:hypothetical protein